jgi:hypothetical protein
MPISISAMFGQLACFGVSWNCTWRNSLAAAGRTGALCGQAPHSKRRHDLGLRHTRVRRGQDMRPIHLLRLRRTFAANVVYGRAIAVGQAQSRLAPENTSDHRWTLANAASTSDEAVRWHGCDGPEG